MINISPFVHPLYHSNVLYVLPDVLFVFFHLFLLFVSIEKRKSTLGCVMGWSKKLLYCDLLSVVRCNVSELWTMFMQFTSAWI
ncbi:hypothetical protein H5410_057707 [Solanum commersonii]|uniref:Uncharacterized protein n=1 Tax=Solanum commersonii TaxID=4109 RepID=A0A9J5WQH8_SOLCO|nr:hypothetical protein H5410_057707 [Solanum commersonii]